MPTYIDFLALMTGITDVSGESRVSMTNNITNNTLLENNSTYNIDKAHQNMYSLVNISATKEGLVNLRCGTTNDDIF